jgi:hypothetical protein
VTAEAPSTPSQYRVVRNGDGTYDILDVPVFSEMDLEDDQQIGIEWMEAALQASAKLDEQGYLPPLHVHHHGTEKSVARAGHFRLRRVDTAVVPGEDREMAVVYADFVGVPEATFQRIMAGELPYRSVEILDIEEARINTLALLDTEEPHFKFPLLNRTSLQLAKRTVFCSKESTMKVKLNAGPVVAQEDCDEDEDKLKLGEGEEDERALNPENAKDDIKSLITQLNASLGAFLKANEKETDDMERAPNLVNVDEKEGPDKDKLAARRKARQRAFARRVRARKLNRRPKRKPVAAKRNTKLLAEVSALRDWQRDEKAKERIAVLCAAAAKDLAGYHLSSDTKESLRAIAKSGGKVALAAFVRTYKSTARKDPTDDLGTQETETTADDEKLGVYAKAGPDVLTTARKLSREYDIAVTKHGVRCTREEYIDVHLDLAKGDQ